MVEEDSKKLSKEINKGKAKIGLDKWDEDSLGSIWDEQSLGLCHNCKHLKAAKTRYGRMRAQCYSFDINLRGIDPIVQCNKHERVGQLSLDHMEEIATLIELTKPIGFEG